MHLHLQIFFEFLPENRIKKLKKSEGYEEVKRLISMEVKHLLIKDKVQHDYGIILNSKDLLNIQQSLK